MTRRMLRLSFSILVFAAACGPEPVQPRALTGPPPIDAARADATDAPARDGSPAPDLGGGSTVLDAGDAAADASTQRPKLPAPDAGVLPAPEAGMMTVEAGMPAADAGADAAVNDAGHDAAHARPPAAGELRVDEVLVNPTGQDVGREWIEIVSLSPAPLDLSALHLADATTDVAVAAGVLAPGARLLLGQVADGGATNGGAPIAVAYGTRLAFNNDGEEILLCVGPCADGAIVASVSWKTLSAGYDGHAVVFDHGADLICPATEPFGTAGDFGTPGAPNVSCAAPDAGF
jgi:hypothetical protein